MANNEHSRGDTLNYINATGAAIASGALIVIGKLAAIAITAIPDGDTGACQIVGAHVLPAAASATGAQGADAYVTSAGNVTGTATGNTRIGVFLEPLLSAQTAAVVKINA